MLKDYQKILLELVGQLELEISNLYKLFAEKFPSHRRLWLDFSDSEIKHVAYIKKLSFLAEEGKIIFDEKTTKAYTVKVIIDDIKNRYKKTLEDQYTIVNVLSFSLSLEQSNIKNKFYDCFSSSDRDATIIINNIKEEALLHASKIKKACEEEIHRS